MMKTVTFSVPAINCGHCVHTIQMEVGDMAGVESVKASNETKQVEISFAEPATEDKIKSLLAEINYPVAG
jgi:copper chaperone CopZ